ncbi:Sodium-dependent transporter [Psychrobacter sp. JB385]|nr:bile acid:sodium symporter [Psychrobacter sp. JB385]SJN15428.1 Sodium-dependent transporter [Psychrobacter sp. JB385]
MRLKIPKSLRYWLDQSAVITPIISFALAKIIPLEPEYAVGVMLLVLCPGSTASNLFTYFAKGGVALSVTLTAIASIITVFSIPIILSFSLIHFMGVGSVFQLPVLKTVLTLVLLTILPISVGMLIKRFAPRVEDNSRRYVSRFGVIFLAFLSYVQRDIIVEAFLPRGRCLYC